MNSKANDMESKLSDRIGEAIFYVIV